MREFLNDLIARASTERPLLLFFGLHSLGLLLLSGARSWRLKTPAAVCLLISVGCLVQGLKSTPSQLGFNAPTAGLLGAFAIPCGVWLIVGGRGRMAGLLGFATCTTGAAGVMFSAGHRMTALGAMTLLVPSLGVLWWFGEGGDSSAAESVGWIERGLCWCAVAAFSVVIAIPLLAWPTSPSPSHEAHPRLRDLVAYPSALLLLSTGAAFSVGVALRLRPPSAKTVS